MVSVVNGYVCQTGCDEVTARKGHDPRNPKDNPVKAAQLASRDGGAGVLTAKSVRFGQDDSTVSRIDAQASARSSVVAFSSALFYDGVA